MAIPSEPSPLVASGDPDAVPAYSLWVELVSRITAQRLHCRSGNEEAAARNISSLVSRVRQLLDSHPGASRFREFALRFLNETLSPCTSRWHGWMTEELRRSAALDEPAAQFRDEIVRRKFREDVQLLQVPLRDAQRELAGLAGVVDYEPPPPAHADLGENPLIAGIGDEVEIKQDFAGALSPAQLNRAESEEILRRRRIGFGHVVMKAVAEDTAERPSEDRRPTESAARDERVLDATGLALSGGGIRSATFCLGIVQVLVKRGMFAQFDYLSTVSGGGYLGSFLSCSLGTRLPEGAEAAQAADDNAAVGGDTATELAAARRRLKDVFQRDRGKTESGLIRHLRNNSKYLLNGGVAARLKMAGVLISGVVWNLLIVLPIPVLAALLAERLNAGGFWGVALAPLEDGGTWFPPAASASAQFARWAAIVFAAAWLFVPAIQWLTNSLNVDSPGVALRRTWERMAIGLGLVALLAGVLFCVPAGFHEYARFSAWLDHVPGSKAVAEWGSVGTAGGASVVLGLFATWLKPQWPRLRGLAVRLFILSGPLLVLWVFLLVGNHLGLATTATQPWDLTWTWIVVFAIIAWAWLFVNINTLAPHRFYRDRLCECYLARRTDPRKSKRLAITQQLTGKFTQGRTESVQRIKLTELGVCAAAPYHLINTTLNTPTSVNKEMRGRNGHFFLISKRHCGSPITGYIPTDEIEKADPHFDLGTAMAVSGAAASTNMGWKSLPHFRFLMTIFNVRLGYWLRRPRAWKVPRMFDRALPWYLWREMTGRMDENCRYLNLSDGGHIENLAAYELLRRRCKFIVCVDAGQEPGMECADLIRLQRYAEIDLGLLLEYNLADLNLQANGYASGYAVLIKIHYRWRKEDGRHPPVGWMLYVKLAMTGAEPPHVLHYRRENSIFPHESTGDQLYDEAQFEAYRKLGECAAESLFRDDITAGTKPADVRAWFQLLANSLLPENDAVKAGAR